MASLSSRTLALRIAQAFGAAIVLALTVAGCSRQAEGERCDSQNGNSDCENGLVCRTAGSLNAPSDVCCPSTGEATTAVCRGQSQGGLDAGIPDTGAADTSVAPDTGVTTDAGTTDSGAVDSGAQTDATADAATDG